MPKRGFTLLEIIVATVIMALIVTGLANLFLGAKRWLMHSRSRMAGGELGKYFLDPLAMYVKQSDWSEANSDYVSPNPLRKRSNEAGAPVTLDKRTYTPYYTVSAPLDPTDPSYSNTTPLRKVKVDIKWSEE